MSRLVSDDDIRQAEERLGAAVDEVNAALAALEPFSGPGMSSAEWSRAAGRYCDARAAFLRAERHHANLVAFRCLPLEVAK